MGLPGAKGGWRLAWEVMVRELAPQDKQGAYQRPTYSFSGRIGGADFPVRVGEWDRMVGIVRGDC
jgi:putative glutathione S-transferase